MISFLTENTIRRTTAKKPS